MYFFIFFLKFIELLPPPNCDSNEQKINSLLLQHRKGVNPMVNTSSYEKTIEYQFDSFCKSVLRNQARNIYEEDKRRNEKLVSWESLTLAELSQLCTYDTYEVECIFLVTHDYKIPIEDILIAQAIESLSSRQQDIILLSFFLSMKDIDIASLMNLTKSTVHYHKDKALCELRKFMEDYKNGN